MTINLDLNIDRLHNNLLDILRHKSIIYDRKGNEWNVVTVPNDIHDSYSFTVMKDDKINFITNILTFDIRDLGKEWFFDEDDALIFVEAEVKSNDNGNS